MEQLSTRKFFNSNFVIKYNLSFSSVILLQDIYHWIFSNKPPKSFIRENKTFYFISQSHFYRLNYGLLTQPAVNKIFSKLKEIGLIESTLREGNENYISFNWEMVHNSVLEDEELQKMNSNEWWKKIHSYADEQLRMEKEGFKESYNKPEEENMLLFDDDMLPEEKPAKKIRYSETAYALAVRIIEKARMNNWGYFTHKYKEYGEEQTKLFTQTCNNIQSIYDGNFINPRLYPFSEKFLSNQSFRLDMSEAKSKLAEVKGDWTKVKKLIFGALENFNLMHNPEYVPCDKKYLVHGLNEWFYAMSFEEAGKFQSQFLQSLSEPMKTPEFYAEKKADNIYDGLTTDVKTSGNKLFEMNVNMNPGTFWEKIKEMTEWAKLVLTSDPNGHYWLSNPGEVVSKFAEWCENREISMSVATIDVAKSFDCNSPFAWFVQEAIEKHGLNRQLVSCVSSDDFLDCYSNSDSGISFDDMNEIPVF